MIATSGRMALDRWAWLASLAAALVVSPQIARANHLEAKMYGVDNWTTTCTGGARSWSAMVDRWYNEITSHGWYYKDGRFVDTGMDRDPFCDPDSGAANCVDYNRIDDGDAVMIFMHGSDKDNHWRGKLRFNGGAAVNDCRIDAPEAATEGGAGGELYVGDRDMEFLHISSCKSMDDDNLSNTWRLMRDPVDSPNSGARLHQVDGFHGLMWIGSSFRPDYEDFAEDAFSTSIKNAWLDNMYRNNIEDKDGDKHEQCPVAYAIGTSKSDCFNRIDKERYNNIFSDPGPIGYYCYYYIKGCDPAGETTFKNPN